MRVLITGVAGFIGMHLALKLLERGDEVVGIDNFNDYYDVTLKQRRLQRGVDADSSGRFKFIRLDLADRDGMAQLFAAEGLDAVVNLAAQAGVRYSIDNPLAYVDSNLVGFAHILEGCRHNGVKHLVYASSSSVYGANESMPFSVHDNVDHPLSLYAASKKANELMAHTYSHLYGLPTTGLRFFTVYGPWSRPDMAMFKFTKAILAGQPIDVFNYGKHRRDFTYIDDIVKGVSAVMEKAPDANEDGVRVKVYNIGNHQPVSLKFFVETLENCLRKAGVIDHEAEKEFLPMQPGDVPVTYADTSALERDFGFKPSTDLRTGLRKFAEWYKEYYNI